MTEFVLVAFLDAYKFGRLGFVDVDLNDPTIVVGHSRKPLLSDQMVRLLIAPESLRCAF